MRVRVRVKVAMRKDKGRKYSLGQQSTLVDDKEEVIRCKKKDRDLIFKIAFLPRI